MKLYEIIENLKFIGIKSYKELEIDALTCDSKEKVENGIYFCLKGLNSDGHKYAEEAIKNGCICLVVEKFLEVDITQILVDDARVTMSYISSIFYETYKSKMKFIGVTGTNGKTTSTFLIRDILSSLGKKVGLIGTQGVFINSLELPATLTTPDPIVLHKTIKDMENNFCEYCVMEVSAHAIALNKIDNIYFDTVALTNITKDHLDFFLTMENYSKCKASLFDVKHAKSGAINVDTREGKEIAKRASIEIMSFGKNAELSMVKQNKTMSGSEIVIQYKNITHDIKTNLIGEYNLYNLMTAISCLINVGIDIKDIIGVINEKEFFIPGRFNVMSVDNGVKVIIDYAHTPDGIKNILSAINALPKNNLITVFGCGGNRDKTKRHEMGEVAVNLSDNVIVTSDNPRDENPDMIIDDIVSNLEIKDYTRITDRRQAIEYALSIAKENDIIAILGKGAESYQEIKGIKFHYSDFEVVENYCHNISKGELKA